MRILFDARMLDHGSGIGVYVRELVKRLQDMEGHEWFFLIRPEHSALIKKGHAVLADIKHYSWEEQLRLPLIIKSVKPDLVHFPNFNVPIFYGGKFIITIHDLAHHKLPGHRRTSLLYRMAYKFVTSRAIKKSRAIITVSKASKSDILEYYPEINPQKIFVITEGAGPEFAPSEHPGELFLLREKYNIVPPYILFVGVWEVKKNLPFLAEVFAELAPDFPELKLVLAGREDPWHPEVRGEIIKKAGRYSSRIIMPGFVETEDMPALYRQAEVFVSPSKFEGFGLPGLEALKSGTPIAVANTPVFREIYGEAASYFNPDSMEEAGAALRGILKGEAAKSGLVKKGLKVASAYTWEEAGARTLKVYEQIFNS